MAATPSQAGLSKHQHRGLTTSQLNIWQRKALLKADLPAPTSNIPCAEVLNPYYIPEPSQSLKRHTCPGLTLTLANQNSERDPGMGIFLKVPQETTVLESPGINV